MSISSCPRCAQQVTLPMGISTGARVRCPLCREEYALADALVNMPPILEVIEDHSEDLSADWLDMPSETADTPDEPVDEAVATGDSSELQLAGESDSKSESFADEQSHDDLVFEAGEIKHDDSAMQQQDTDVEDLSIEVAPVADESAQTFDPLDVAPAEEPDALDFGPPLPSAETTAAADDELDIDFAESPTTDEPAAMGDFADDLNSPPLPPAGEDEFEIDFSEPSASSADDAELDLGQPVAAESDSEELSLDFDEPVAAAGPAEEAQSAELPTGKKKKEKKEKTPKAGSSELNLASESDSESESFADEQSHDDLVFEAGEIEHDDSAMQQQDTEVEDLGFEVAPVADEGAQTFDPLDVAPAEEPDVLDFGPPLPSAETTAAGDDELDIDFAESPPRQEPAAMGDFADDLNSPPLPPAGEDEFEIDFSEPSASSADDAESDSEELSLDFGEPSAAAGPAEEAQSAELPAGKKKKDKKEKKEKKPKAEKPPADPAKKRSLVGLMLNFVLPAILAVPLALWGALWISPDYDFFGFGPALARYGLAPSNKGMMAQAPAKPPVLPVTNSPATEPETKPAVDATETLAPATTDAPGGEPSKPAPVPPEPAAEEKPADTAVTEPPATPEPAVNTPEPTEHVAGKPEAPNETPEAPPESATVDSNKPAEPAAEPADTSLDSLLGEDAKKPEEMPAEEATPAAPAGDEPATTAKTPEELPPLPAEKAEEIATPGEEPGLRDAPTVTVAEVDKALHTFAEANEKMALAQAADDKAEIRKLRSTFYLSLYGLADAISLAKDDPDGGQLDGPRESAERLALELAAEPTQFKELKSYGAKWLAFGKRTTEGVVLAGTVQSAEQIGKLYHVRIELAADAPPQTIVTKNDPQVQAGDAVVAMGSIVKRPLEQLNGYEGSDSQVVWGGMTLKLPAQ